MLKKLGFWLLMIIGFVSIALPAIGWGKARGISSVGAWILVIVGGGVVLLLAELLAGAVLEGSAAWAGSKLPEPVRRSLGKKIGGPLILLGLLAIFAAGVIFLIVRTT